MPRPIRLQAMLASAGASGVVAGRESPCTRVVGYPLVAYGCRACLCDVAERGRRACRPRRSGTPRRGWRRACTPRRRAARALVLRGLRDGHLGRRVGGSREGGRDGERHDRDRGGDGADDPAGHGDAPVWWTGAGVGDRRAFGPRFLVGFSWATARLRPAGKRAASGAATVAAVAPSSRSQEPARHDPGPDHPRPLLAPRHSPGTRTPCPSSASSPTGRGPCGRPHLVSTRSGQRQRHDARAARSHRLARSE